MSSVLITGASSGIGEAVALHLDELGHRVFAGVRTAEAGERLEAKASGGLRSIALDICDPDLVSAAAALVAGAVGPAGLDALVNNAGIATGGPAEFVTMDEWRHQFEVNVFGQVAVTQAMLPSIRAARGRIVFVGSISGRVSMPLGAAYGASKHAIAAVAQSLRAELHPWGIGVSLVEPGAVRTAIWDKGRTEIDVRVPDLTPDQKRLYGASIERLRVNVDKAARTAGTPDRVVQAIDHALFAKRPRARYLAGRDAQLVGMLDAILPDRLLSLVLRRTAP